MADVVNINQSASEMVAAINEAFDDTVVAVIDTATEMVSELNTKFADGGVTAGLSASENAVTFVGKVNDAFESLEEQSQIDDSDLADIPDFKFLHISDTHGSNISSEMKTIANGDNLIKFLIHTGDSGSNDTNGFDAYAPDKNFLFVKGNHDAKEQCENRDINIFVDVDRNNNSSNYPCGKFFLGEKMRSWMERHGAVFGDNTVAAISGSTGNYHLATVNLKGSGLTKGVTMTIVNGNDGNESPISSNCSFFVQHQYGQYAYSGSATNTDYLNRSQGYNVSICYRPHDFGTHQAFLRISSMATTAEFSPIYIPISGMSVESGSNVPASATSGTTASSNGAFSTNVTAINFGTVVGKLTQYTQNLRKCSYWHEDYQLNEGRKLRIIGLDLYDAADGATTSYADIIPLTQAKWFIDRLKELKPQDFFIIAAHEPLIYDRVTTLNSSPSGLNKSAYGTRIRRQNPWNRHNRAGWYTTMISDSGMQAANDFITKIVGLYLTKGNEGVSQSWKNGTSTTVTCDFRSCNPATFLCYLTGHTHTENVCYVSDDMNDDYFRHKQLHINIDCSKSDSQCAGSDMTYSANGIPNEASGNRNNYKASDDKPPVNLVTLDWANQRIILDRVYGTNILSHHVVDHDANPTTNADRYDLHEDGYIYDVDAPWFVKGGGYWDGITYHATNDDGSINDDVDYVSLNSSGKVADIYTYEVDGGSVVCKKNGETYNGVVDHTNLFLRRKKISFPFKRVIQ